MARPPVLVDTGYFVALLNRRDKLHRRAEELAALWAQSGRSLLTTDAVLIELGNFFAESPLRASAIAAIRQLRSAHGWAIERLTPRLIERAEARYGMQHDKGWSLTDCLSMEVMLERACKEAATPDHHFVQAGFAILMAKP